MLYDLLDPYLVHDLFSKSDLTLLLSSYGESFPNVIAEAMLYGTIPIATDIGESALIINKYGEVISKDSSPEIISNLIYKYYLIKNNQPDNWNKLIKECGEFAKKRFGIKKVANEFKKIANT